MNPFNPSRTLARAVLALILSIVPGFATQRTLTAADGRTLEARLISKTDDSVGIIRTTDEMWFVIQLDTLSEVDREFIKNWTPTPEPFWNQDAFNREMVQPVEGFASHHARRTRRHSRSFEHFAPARVYFGGYWPVAPVRFHDYRRDHYRCFHRPIISVNIR